MDGNYALAQNCLGLCYELGYGVGVDEKRAAELYSMAASQGDSSGQFNLGLMYLHGRGVPKDTAMAESWLSKAAEGGHSDAKEILLKMRGEVNGGGGV
jgi:TPR repeat protein